jgi:hypothetical protein
MEAAWHKLPIAESLPTRKVPDLVVLVSAQAPAVLAARALALAADSRLEGRHLAVLSLASPLPASLAGELLDLGPAGAAVATGGVRDVAGLAAAMGRVGRGVRAEALPGPGVWTYGISGSRPPGDSGERPPSPSPRRSPR